jgi:hypothetical protein
MQPLRYVVLQHAQIDESHFDLMFETLPGSMLATFRSERWPIETRTALRRLRDHRRLYLEYEGEIAGGRGAVYRMAEGTCELEIGENSVWSVRLLSGSPPGRLLLRQIDGERWEASPES